ncbi:hypothetical protein C492_07675 [Natronococcus jeotgali DSM 18795]|uniref:Uncharacterized protein n=1 Tax=Natronococcus jeotgali DSM 18795 TaxID=1227498 RepID=L9XM32_9EURY|nr:hypothetical protein C492_07675 [Natronococcus jeotgali DSM 18795]
MGTSDVLFPALFWRLDVSCVRLFFSLSNRTSAVGDESADGDGLVFLSSTMNASFRTQAPFAGCFGFAMFCSLYNLL